MNRFICYLTVSVLTLSSAFAESPKVGGRIMYDYAVYDSDDAQFNDGGEMRRARLFVKGTLDEDWFYKFQYDFTASGEFGIRDAYLGYSGLSFLDSIRIGSFIEYGSLEDSTSSKYIMFLERSLPCLAFFPAPRRMGIGADAHGDAFYAGAGVFGEPVWFEGLLGDFTPLGPAEPGYGTSGRAVWIPASEEGNTLHLGAFGQFRIPPGYDAVRYRARPEAHVDRNRLIDTGNITNVSNTVKYGLEFAWIINSVVLQAEYMGVVVDRDGLSSESYDGAYISAGWYLTGESQGYDAECATLARTKPLKPLGEGGIGAVALTCRFSTLDLNDGIAGGEEDNVTIGLNWHPTARTRFMVNYVNAQADVEGVETEVDIVQIRTQVDF